MNQKISLIEAGREAFLQLNHPHSSKVATKIGDDLEAMVVGMNRDGLPFPADHKIIVTKQDVDFLTRRLSAFIADLSEGDYGDRGAARTFPTFEKEGGLRNVVRAIVTYRVSETKQTPFGPATFEIAEPA